MLRRSSTVLRPRPRGARVDQQAAPLYAADAVPLGVGGLLDAAVELVRRHSLALWGGAVLLCVPVEVVRLALLRGQGLEFGRMADLPWYSLYGMLGMAVQVGLLPLAAALALRESGLHGESGGASSALRVAYGRPVALLALAPVLLAAMLLSAGGCPCFFPGILLAWLLCAAPAVLVLEGRDALSACARSFELARGGLGRWFCWWSVIWVADTALQVGVSQLAEPGVRDRVLEFVPLGGATYDVSLALVTAPLLGLGKALFASGCALWYLEQRLHHERAAEARVA